VVLLAAFQAGTGEFQTGWFLLSLPHRAGDRGTMRSRRPIWVSAPSRLLVVLSITTAAAGTAFLYSPLASPLGLVRLPVPVLLSLAGIVAAYIAYRRC